MPDALPRSISARAGRLLMKSPNMPSLTLSRRHLLLGSGLCLLGSPLPVASQPTPGQSTPLNISMATLVARAREAQLLPAPMGKTAILAYGDAPFAALRAKQGQPFNLRFTNELSVPTSLFWHGLRTIGASPASQLVKPGDSLDIAFTPMDAGTFFFRSGTSPTEQAERGLVGALIVDEAIPPEVDQDVVLLLKDVLIDQNGRMDDGYDAPQHQRMGRLGNVLAVNGVAERLDIPARINQRLRLRFINACSGRILPVRIEGAPVKVMALDGQPCEPFPPQDNVTVLAPGSRADIYVDVEAGERTINAFIDGQPIPLARIIPPDATVRRPRPLPPALPLPPNPGEVKLDLARARRVSVSMVAQETVKQAASKDPKGNTPAPDRWRFYTRKDADAGDPLFRVPRGSHVVLQLDNFTPVPQSIHVQGQRLRPLDKLDDGWKPWQLDTVLLFEQDSILLGFIADTPGKWQISSSILAHQASGVTGWFEVE